MTTKNVTDENFESEVLKATKPTLVDFWAEWCGPCKQVGPILEEISNEMPDVEFGVLDIDSQPNSPIRPEFSVRVITSCFLVKSGSVVGSKIGMTNKQDFVSWIKENI